MFPGRRERIGRPRRFRTGAAQRDRPNAENRDSRGIKKTILRTVDALQLSAFSVFEGRRRAPVPESVDPCDATIPSIVVRTAGLSVVTPDSRANVRIGISLRADVSAGVPMSSENRRGSPEQPEPEGERFHPAARSSRARPSRRGEAISELAGIDRRRGAPERRPVVASRCRVHGFEVALIDPGEFALVLA